MAKPTVNITTKPDTKKVAAPYKKSYIELIDERLRILADITHRKIQQEAPRRSGDLREAIVVRRRKQMDYEILVDGRRRGARYERKVRLGMPAAKVNPILPSKKSALFWQNIRGGRPVAAVYNHPGFKANDYWSRGLSNSESDRDAAEKTIQNSISRELITK